MTALIRVHRKIESCNLCPRLREYCKTVAKIRRKAYAAEEYWGKPLKGFGDPAARLGVIGLAPAAHGGNRTGRVFTGDRSADWLYRALHKAGYSNQPISVSRDDGLKLKDAYVSCVVKCAPPDNKPLPDELERCSSHLKTELAALERLEGFVVLGQIALHGLWASLGRGPRPKFSHLGQAELPDGRWIVMSYHPSQQNTFTGRLTEPMLDAVFTETKRRLKR
ncbi:MAG TPA: uracil-DNA glycosylase [Bdellovibrionota bacterium]|nr:uracil-DNA glycosylase [Bdellovibrionota bacterium]